MIINLTPSPVTITHPDGFRTLPVDRAGPARTEEQWTREDSIDGLPVVGRRVVGVFGLPPPTDSAWYIVTPAVAEAAYHTGRSLTDLLVPGEPHHDDGGRWLGYRSLARWSPQISDRSYLETFTTYVADRMRGEHGVVKPANDSQLLACLAIAESLAIGISQPVAFAISLHHALSSALDMTLQAHQDALAMQQRWTADSLRRARLDTRQ